MAKIFQIERHLGVLVARIGPGECPETRKCVSGCWVRPELEDGYVLIDANSSSVVGPKIRLVSGCGCSAPSAEPSGTKEPPFHSRPVVKEASNGDCGEGGCLNGGRCAPQGGTLR